MMQHISFPATLSREGPCLRAALGAGRQASLEGSGRRSEEEEEEKREDLWSKSPAILSFLKASLPRVYIAADNGS